MANYAFTTGKPLPAATNGQTFEQCNFAQLHQHTAIFAGVTGLTFVRCNLTNCDIPADAVRVQSINSQIEFCSHLNPKFVAHGLIACAENCTHVVSTDAIQVGGVTQATVYHYENRVVA